MSRRDEAAVLRERGLTNRQIARALGVHEWTLWNWFGASVNSRSPYREDDERDSLQCRAEGLEWEGLSIREIAHQLDVPRSTVHGWLRRRAA